MTTPSTMPPPRTPATLDVTQRSAADLPYAPRRAPGDVIDFVVCQWNARMFGDHLMVPDGCVEVMWLEGRGVIVCGPERSAWPVHHERPVTAAGVRLRPGAVEAVLGVPAHAIVDTRVALEDLISPTLARRVSASVEMAAPEQRSTLLASLVRAQLGDLRVAPPRTQRLADQVLRSDGLAGLADALGTTTRSLHRSSLRAFGYGPATLRSVLRLQRALALHRAAPRMRIAELAARAGYVDQAHFAKDARRRAGLTPRELLASPAVTWHGEGAVVNVRSVQDGAVAP